VDRGFALISQRYKHSDVYTGEQAAECIRAAGTDLTADHIGHTAFRDFASVFGDRGWRKCGALLKHQYFEFSSDQPGAVRCRPYAKDEWEQYQLFDWKNPASSKILMQVPAEREEDAVFVDMPDEQYLESVRSRIPPLLPRKGYKPIKEHDIFNKLRPYFPAAYRAEMAPVPTCLPPSSVSGSAMSVLAQAAVVSGQDWSEFDPALHTTAALARRARGSFTELVEMPTPHATTTVVAPPSASTAAPTPATRPVSCVRPPRVYRCAHPGCDGTGHRRWKKWADTNRCMARWLEGHTTKAGCPRKHGVEWPSPTDIAAYQSQASPAPAPAPIRAPGSEAAPSPDLSPTSGGLAPQVTTSTPSTPPSVPPKRKSIAAQFGMIEATPIEGRRSRRREK
jgi:hypothetical protein